MKRYRVIALLRYSVMLATGLSRMKLLLKRRFGIPMCLFVVILLSGLATGRAEGMVFFYQEPRQYVMAQARPEEKNPPVLLPAKIMDNFDGITDVIFTWWDGDGAEVYQRSLDSDFKRSGLYSMKIDYIKRSEKYKFSFFAFQPKQDGVNNDFSKHERLSLWLHTKSPLELIIKLQDKNKNIYEENFKLEGKEEWQHIELNLFNVRRVDLSKIDNVFFFAQPGQYKVKGTFWLDDVYLVKIKDTPPIQPETPQNLDYGEKDGIFKFSWTDESLPKATLFEVCLANNLEFNNPIILWTNNNFLEFWEQLPEWSYFKVRAWYQLPEYDGKSSTFSEVWAKK